MSSAARGAIASSAMCDVSSGVRPISSPFQNISFTSLIFTSLTLDEADANDAEASQIVPLIMCSSAFHPLHHLAPSFSHMTFGSETRAVRIEERSFGSQITHLSGVDLLTAEGVFVGTHSGGVVLLLVVFLETPFVIGKC